ncbi:MAG: protoporphyrinogen oxidase [Bellilinea sp.]
MPETNHQDPRVPQITIIGGGISGLAAAYEVQRQAREQSLPVAVTLLEEEERLGGKILTEQVDGFTIEGGPDCFIRQKPYAAELAAAVGLVEDLIDTNDEKRKTYVINKGKLTPLPDGVMLIIPTRIKPFVTSPLFSWPGKIRMGMDLFIRPFAGNQDETIAQFTRRRLGNEALEKLAEPLLSGIHVSDPETQSLLATFPRFRALEQRYGSLTKGMLAERKLAARHRRNGAKPASIFQSLRGGLGQLPTALEASLTDCTIYKGSKVERIERAGSGYRLTLSNESTLETDALILAIPAYQAAALLEPLQPQAAAELNAIHYVSTATISLAYRKADLKRELNGFGFVAPRLEKRKISACTWSSIKFDNRAPADMLLMRCFLGGPGKEEMVDLSDEEIIQVTRQELDALLGIQAEPVLTRIYRWIKANPQYDLGHLERVDKIFSLIESDLPGIYLTGSAYRGVGVPDCINQGKKSADELLKFLQQNSVTT